MRLHPRHATLLYRPAVQGFLATPDSVSYPDTASRYLVHLQLSMVAKLPSVEGLRTGSTCETRRSPMAFSALQGCCSPRHPSPALQSPRAITTSHPPAAGLSSRPSRRGRAWVRDRHPNAESGRKRWMYGIAVNYQREAFDSLGVCAVAFFHSAAALEDAVAPRHLSWMSFAPHLSRERSRRGFATYGGNPHVIHRYLSRSPPRRTQHTF